MLAVISPAKSMDFETKPRTRKKSTPAFLDDSTELIDGLKKLAPQDVSSLMGISDKLGLLNADRYAAWSCDTKKGKQAALAFTGDVYMGLSAWDLGERELTSLQRRVRILSGLYGLLKPLDLIHPYRLEMGTTFANQRGKDLYAFWGDKVTEALNDELATHRNPVLVNLASNEYWGVVRPKQLNAKVINTRFLDVRDGKAKMISFFAKKARGLMAAHIAKEKVETLKALKAFNAEGYTFDPDRSTNDEYVYVRS